MAGSGIIKVPSKKPPVANAGGCAILRVLSAPGFRHLPQGLAGPHIWACGTPMLFERPLSEALRGLPISPSLAWLANLHASSISWNPSVTPVVTFPGLLECGWTITKRDGILCGAVGAAALGPLWFRRLPHRTTQQVAPIGQASLAPRGLATVQSNDGEKWFNSSMGWNMRYHRFQRGQMTGGRGAADAAA